ncbi:transposase [Streptomyces anulatus]
MRRGPRTQFGRAESGARLRPLTRLHPARHEQWPHRHGATELVLRAARPASGPRRRHCPRAVDTTPWLRLDAATSDQRTFCHTYGRAEGAYELVPGWSYSIVAALTSGPTSWTAPLDALRLRPGDHLQQVTADQLHRIVVLGRWKAADVPIRGVADCGYDGPYLAHQLADLPVEVCVRLRGDRVLYCDAPRAAVPAPKAAGPGTTAHASPSIPPTPGDRPPTTPSTHKRITRGCPGAGSPL